jgi:galactose mutarotase-like enzyme
MPKVTHTNDALETLRLDDEATGAVVYVAPARGGMVTRYAVGGADVLFLDESTLHDPSKNVRGGIPILFPVAGKLPAGRYRVEGETYEIKQHGFARDRPGTVVDESSGEEASVTLGLEASDATRAVYPFDFALRFTYRLRGGQLSVEQTFENRGRTPMPVQPGLHPYFFVPDASKADARVETDATRAYDNRIGREVPVPRPIPLAGREVDLFLLDHSPRETVLSRPGRSSVRLAFGDEQRVLVVWTLPGRDFVCVEPWWTRAGAIADGTAPRIAAGAAATTTLSLSSSATG